MSKEKPIHVRLLLQSDLQQFYFTFLEAFSDYSVDMQLDRKAFDRRMLDKLSINWDLSVGAFSGDKMVGFIAHTNRNYQNHPCAYNGGTGVIPEYRGLELTKHMYDVAIQQMRKMKISKCVLEVIDNNERALAAYEKIGFSKVRKLKCYKLRQPRATTNTLRVVMEPLRVNDLIAYNDLTITSFMDIWDQLDRNRSYEKMILHRNDQKAVVGYCVFQPDSGRIARIWVNEENRGQGLGKSLIASAGSFSNRPLTVINVDENDHGAHQFLIACGFENQINQWEMMLDIV